MFKQLILQVSASLHYPQSYTIAGLGVLDVIMMMTMLMAVVIMMMLVIMIMILITIMIMMVLLVFTVTGPSGTLCFDN